ncbi:SWI/SNF complex component SNF12-like [Heracleum sosnowskyi]|uniref:SWI/SNF complex component SNF12-like n=1 Tax=Heracleum sosnowskyi TaxID=360622 RepID=A0AAD8M5W0_9APIA|nr:SWI/SNF complex component SNF12-like [Heracleum sosnowskyi]
MASNNNNNAMKNVGVPGAFGNSGVVSQTTPLNHQMQSHLMAQANSQAQGGAHFQGHFQMSDRHHAQALAQAQYAHLQQVRGQTPHNQFQTQAQVQSYPQMNSQGINNSNVSSPSIATPGTGSAKRPPQKQSARPPSSSGPGSASPLKAMELTPAANRKKRKLPEKQIPDKVAALLPESALYTQLLEFESRVDAALSRKKLDIQESLKNRPHVQKTLRLYVFNTFSNQRQRVPEKENAEPPSWSLKILGRVLEDEADPGAASTGQSSNVSYPKFSSFFKKVTIYLDQSLYPDNHVIVWDSARSPAPHEGFEVKRKGDKEFTAMIRLEMNYVPEKFKLSPVLSEVLGIEVETRPRIISAIWHYVKARKLQISTDPSFFMCDAPLKKIFGEDKVKFGMIPLKISSHLTPPQPIHLEYKIKLSGNSSDGCSCYDLLVDIPYSLDKDMANFLANLDKHKEIDACDEAISSAIKKIHEHRLRRAFFLGFSQSPADFIDALIASQSKDLKLLSGDANHNAEKERRSEFYNQPWLEDAVIRYINRKPAAGNDAPGST